MVRLSGLRLKLVACFMHLVPVLLISGMAVSGNPLTSKTMRGFVAAHFCLILMLLDSSISCPLRSAGRLRGSRSPEA